MHQFYIENLEKPTLSKTQKHQLKQVLRMRVGDKIRLVDLNGDGAIVEIKSDDFTSFEIIEPLQFTKQTQTLKIIASLIRNERLEWMIQKAAETGVDEIVLYQAQHGVVKSYGNKESRKLERFNTIALEASEQAYRQFPLKVTQIIDQDAIKDELLVQNFYADTHDAPSFSDEIVPNQDTCILVGPEGGFSDKECAQFDALSIKAVSLGERILRAETAPMVLAVLFNDKNKKR